MLLLGVLWRWKTGQQVASSITLKDLNRKGHSFDGEAIPALKALSQSWLMARLADHTESPRGQGRHRGPLFF